MVIFPEPLSRFTVLLLPGPLSRRVNERDQIEDLAELTAILARLRAALLAVSDEFIESIKARVASKPDDGSSLEQPAA